MFYTPEDYRPDESAAYLMRRILTLMAGEVDEALEPQGLTHAQWVPLMKLHMGLASTVAELARECQLDGGAMTRTLDRLEAKGLVERVRSCEDRRVVNLQLTPEGREAAKQIPQVLCKVQNAFLEGLSVEEWLQLKSLLQRILDNGTRLQGSGREGNE
ncbi:MAG TPA: MarR family transcriptional regulator [Ramlibacter sp.]|uniref:MarR family winged helix-turn-helix transcriptional regulator n=1 Tax=Ramlibacter sp. TaxID=1917967 RepID=UPI002D7F7888|nr:MarR family transcriptional regulator [Ramlibacter sp.]HET8747049.1 MarR family transcriptional regulator [Ramlibacter sp.]